ncbi:hypothetical protein KIPB_010336 [Kipferlia bialata]|uniref:Uncharacterized protein n=1 Tax=Kipferlia bialata TaxID=797122 RepID=A0A9K3GMA2_9EUKA|nr:hypothetical protein KIPB_010336 [Kipferlia bialata]|eukprot:g10336.t1
MAYLDHLFEYTMYSRIAIFVMELYCYLTMLARRSGNHVSRSALVYMTSILCITSVASAAAILFNFTFLKGDIETKYSRLPYKGYIIFVSGGAPTFVSLCLISLYLALFKGILPSRSLSILKRCQVIVSVLLVGLAALACAADQLYCNDVYRQGIDYYQSQIDSGAWSVPYWLVIGRLRIVSSIAVGILLCLIVALTLYRRSHRRKLHRQFNTSPLGTALVTPVTSGSGSPRGVSQTRTLAAPPSVPGALVQAPAVGRAPTVTKGGSSKLVVMPWVYAAYCVSYISLSILSMLGFVSMYRYLLVPANLVEGLCLSVIIYPLWSTVTKYQMGSGRGRVTV